MNTTTTARLINLWEVPSDQEAFLRHYHEVHIPLAKGLPGLRSYQLLRDVSPVRGEPYFMVGELAWDSMDELTAAMTSACGRETAADVAVLQRYATLRSMILGPGDVVV